MVGDMGAWATCSCKSLCIAVPRVTTSFCDGMLLVPPNLGELTEPRSQWVNLDIWSLNVP